MLSNKGLIASSCQILATAIIICAFAIDKITIIVLSNEYRVLRLF